MTELFVQKSSASFSNSNDEMPNQVDTTGDVRRKLLHQKGVVGTVRLVADNQSDYEYTGLWQ